MSETNGSCDVCGNDDEGGLRLEFVGPFKEYRVVVNGWQVPLLEGEELDGGTVWLTLDNRLGCEIPAGLAEKVVPFIADCIAVALGYGCHPRGDEVPREVALKRGPLVRPKRLLDISAVSTEE
jgi:hypothetical protein